jgi:hypothetical protein
MRFLLSPQKRCTNFIHADLNIHPWSMVWRAPVGNVEVTASYRDVSTLRA